MRTYEVNSLFALDATFPVTLWREMQIDGRKCCFFFSEEAVRQTLTMAVLLSIKPTTVFIQCLLLHVDQNKPVTSTSPVASAMS